MLDVLAVLQHGAAKAGALHLRQLVYQYLTGSANVALVAVAAAQLHGLAVGAAVGKFGEMQFHQIYGGQISCYSLYLGIVANMYDI